MASPREAFSVFYAIGYVAVAAVVFAVVPIEKAVWLVPPFVVFLVALYRMRG